MVYLYFSDRSKEVTGNLISIGKIEIFLILFTTITTLVVLGIREFMIK